MTTQPPGFDLGRPASLIAALPAVLGFIPEHSLAVVTIDGGELGCVMRVDLSPGLAQNTDHLAEVVGAAGHAGAVAVIVDEDGPDCPACDSDHELIADELMLSMDRHDIELHAVLAVDRIAEGGRWSCLCGCGAGGFVDDPASSPLAAAAVLDGRRLYRRRADLQQVVAVVDTERRARLTELLPRLRGAALSGRAARAAVHAAITSAAGVGAGAEPADTEVVEVVRALSDPRVRDMLYALAVGAAADDAESLWAVLARVLPDPWRAEVLTLLAFSAYARGDGPLAGIALEEALTVDPGHRMAGMLDHALQSGMRPEQIRELARSGYQTAAALRVQLPPRRVYGRRAG